ncbi:MAG TPA: type II secretion system protein [Opitutaceae bacterium]|nr:type II secretion system protein [Opitutaceae bacterium]
MRGPRRTGGFTLLELVIAVMLIGLLTSMVVGGFANVIPAGRETAAVNKARIINAARVTYGLTVPDAATEWANALTDADRAALLVNAGALSGAAADWLSASGGYTLALPGGLRTKTVLRDRAGTPLNYPD